MEPNRLRSLAPSAPIPLRIGTERPALAVFAGDGDVAAKSHQASGRSLTFQRGSRLSAASTVREFWQDWYTPVVHVGEKGSKQKTIDESGVSVGWWEVLTDDPGLGSIDAYTLADLQDGLRGATFRKGPHAPVRVLRRATQVKHLKAIRAILERVGPTVDREKPSAGLVEHVPYYRILSVKRDAPGPSFTLDEVRAVVAAASRLADRAARREWLVRLGLLFYTGIRIGSCLAARSSMIAERNGRPWLVLPGDDVKTGNTLAVPLHPEFFSVLMKHIPETGSGADVLLCPWGLHPRTLTTHHHALQELAGIKQPRGFHAYRRTHAEQMNLLGAGHAQLASQASLDHASKATTSEFYSNARALLIDQLPKIFVDCDEAGQLRLF